MPRTKLAPAERERLILKWTRIYMVGIYAATALAGAVMALASGGQWGYLAGCLCMLGLSFPPVAGARGTQLLPELRAPRAGQLRTLKRLWGLTGVLVFAFIVLAEARHQPPPLAVSAATVLAGTGTGLYALVLLVA